MNFSTSASKKWSLFNPSQFAGIAFLLFGCWLMVIVLGGLVRPIFPSNELRYISVAWEMWAHHSFIVPLQGIHPYPHKPPLLFWLVQAGWWLFGVNSWWPRLVPELFGLASLGMLYLIGRYLWPQQLPIAQLAPVLLMGMMGWLGQLDLFKFDVMVSFFVLGSVYFLLQALTKGSQYWGLLAITIALGILTKGPVCLLFILPAMILIPYWFSAYKLSDYYKMAASLLLALVLVFLWAGPAAWLGGKSYTQAIFWHQSAGRIAGEFGGIKHWYVYFEFLLWLLFPWSLWLTLWRGGWNLFTQWRNNHQDCGLRLILSIIIPAFVFLSLIPVKSERYIIPLLPWFALFFTYVLVKLMPVYRRYDQLLIGMVYIGIGILYLVSPHISSPSFQDRFFWIHELSPVWGCILIGLGFLVAMVRYGSKTITLNITLISIAVFTVYNLGWVRLVAKHNDLRPMAQQLAQIEQKNAPIALYQSDFEFEFFGRLQHPSTLLYSQHAFKKWLENNPKGWVVSVDSQVYPKQFILKPASWYQDRNN